MVMNSSTILHGARNDNLLFGFLYIGQRKQDGGNCRRRRVAMKLGCGM